jgi:nucleolysin TIA-1/TIAR
MVGPIDSCKLIKDKNTGASAGYGFMDYFDHHTAAIALQQFAGKLLYGLEIKVNWAFANTAKEDTATHSHIFVGDLSPDVDDRALNAAFSAFGVVT